MKWIIAKNIERGVGQNWWLSDYSVLAKCRNERKTIKAAICINQKTIFLRKEGRCLFNKNEHAKKQKSIKILLTRKSIFFSIIFHWLQSNYSFWWRIFYIKTKNGWCTLRNSKNGNSLKEKTYFIEWIV